MRGIILWLLGVPLVVMTCCTCSTYSEPEGLPEFSRANARTVEPP